MSALANYKFFLEEEDSFDEAETLKAIGRAAALAQDERSAVGELMEAALSAPGVRKIVIEGDKLLSVLGSLSWSLDGSAALVRDNISVPVKANGREWGQLRLWFDSRIRATESARQLGAFLGQQFGLLVNRLVLTRQIQQRQNEASGLLRRIEVHKKLQRAANYVAITRRVSHNEAIQFMVNYARVRPASLIEIADALILKHETGKRIQSSRHHRAYSARA